MDSLVGGTQSPGVRVGKPKNHPSAFNALSMTTCLPPPSVQRNKCPMGKIGPAPNADPTAVQHGLNSIL